MNHLVSKAYEKMKANQTNSQPIHIIPTPVEEAQEEVRKIQERSKQLKEAGFFDDERIIITGKKQI